MFLSDLKMLLGFMPSVRFVECTQCQACSSSRNRQCPFCNASFPENCVTRNFEAEDFPDERIQAFITCPGCERSLELQTEKCPKCGAIIEHEYASQSYQTNATIGLATLHSQNIETLTPGVVVIIVVTVAVTAGAIFLDLQHVAWLILPSLMATTIMLLKIKQWFRWFASFKSDHEDFVTARSKVTRAYRYWLVTLAAQLSLVVLMLGWLFFTIKRNG